MNDFRGLRSVDLEDVHWGTPVFRENCMIIRSDLPLDFKAFVYLPIFPGIEPVFTDFGGNFEKEKEFRERKPGIKLSNKVEIAIQALICEGRKEIAVGNNDFADCAKFCDAFFCQKHVRFGPRRKERPRSSG